MAAAEGTFAGRSLPDPGFAGDDGGAADGLVDALASGDGGAVVVALLAARVLVPVVAVLDVVEAGDGLPREKSADLAVVTVRAPDGRLALPVFSSTSAMATWNSSARPVPVAGVLAARAAYDEGADTLLIDPAGPRRVVLDGTLLRALAEGRAPRPPLGDPDVRAAVEATAVSVGLRPAQVALEPGESVDLVVRLTIDADVPDTEAARTAHALGAALARDPVVSSRLGSGLDLVVDRGPAG